MMSTSRENNFGIILQEKVRYYFTYLLQILFSCFLFASHLFLMPFLFIINWSFKFMNYFIKTISLIFTLVFTGIDGVRKRIGRHYHANQINYAVLKGNGQYLKLQNQTLQATLVCQLYDYVVKKFMTISDIDQDLKVAEIEFSGLKGLQFLKQKLGIKTVYGLSNKQKKILKLKQSHTEINLKYTKYTQNEEEIEPIDIFILLNSLKQPSYGIHIDLIRVFGFIKNHINKNGYVIFGKYFDSEGENQVFEELFSSFGFRIDIQEDITPNILHAQKMLKKIHKNRKLAWSFFKIKEFIQGVIEKQNPFSKILKGLWIVIKRLAGRINTQPRFIVYILQKK